MNNYFIAITDRAEIMELYKLSAIVEKSARIEFVNKALRNYFTNENFKKCNCYLLAKDTQNSTQEIIRTITGNGYFSVSLLTYTENNIFLNKHDEEKKFTTYEEAETYFYSRYEEIKKRLDDLETIKALHKMNIYGLKLYIDYNEKSAEYNLKWKKINF